MGVSLPGDWVFRAFDLQSAASPSNQRRATPRRRATYRAVQRAPRVVLAEGRRAGRRRAGLLDECLAGGSADPRHESCAASAAGRTHHGEPYL
jgi:hypothetical protein